MGFHRLPQLIFPTDSFHNSKLLWYFYHQNTKNGLLRDFSSSKLASSCNSETKLRHENFGTQ